MILDLINDYLSKYFDNLYDKCISDEINNTFALDFNCLFSRGIQPIIFCFLRHIAKIILFMLNDFIDLFVPLDLKGTYEFYNLFF